MLQIKKYAGIALIIMLLLLAVYTLLLKNRRDSLQHQLEAANNQLTDLVNVNQNQKNTIAFLNQQAEDNRQYTLNLELRYQETEQLLIDQEQQFERLKDENETVNDWANQPLPARLY